MLARLASILFLWFLLLYRELAPAIPLPPSILSDTWGPCVYSTIILQKFMDYMATQVYYLRLKQASTVIQCYYFCSFI